MLTQQLIEITHKSQSDAGPLINFNEKFTATLSAIREMERNKCDPVAAFISATIHLYGITEDGVEAMVFYLKELKKAVNAIESIRPELLNQ